MRPSLALSFSIIVLLFLPSGAAAGGGTEAIWVIPPDATSSARTASPLSYGQTFTAGYSSKTSQPWGFAECWADETTELGTPNQGSYAPGDVIWSGYRSLWAGGPSGGPFELTDPIQQLWLGGGAKCRLSLVKYSGGNRRTVLATSRFDVAP